MPLLTCRPRWRTFLVGTPPCSAHRTGAMNPYGPPPSTKVLIAATEPVRRRLIRVLDGHDLTTVMNGTEGMPYLSNDKFGMVILSVDFDESQMFALLGDIRGHGKY